MGYYENPPIIERAKSGEMIAAGIEKFAAGIASGIQNYAAIVDKTKKEQELTLKKLQERKNEVDLEWNKKLDEWNSKQDHLGDTVDKQIYEIIQGKIRLAASSQIKLLNETNPKLRQQYLENISKANSALDNAGLFAKTLGGETATYRTQASAGTYGTEGGYIVNGTTEEMLNNTGALDILSGMYQLYDDPKIEVKEGVRGDDFIISVAGIDKKTGKQVKKEINSYDYLRSDQEANNSLLSKSETRSVNVTQAREKIMDKDNIRVGFLSPTLETVDLPSKGDVDFRLVGARRLNVPLIMNTLKEEAAIEATGRLVSKPADLRTFFRTTLNSLDLPLNYYDDTFSKLTPEEQKTQLTDMLTTDSFNRIIKKSKLYTTTEKDENGNETTVYWENKPPDVSIKKEPKLTSARGGRGGKGPTEAEKNYAYAVEAVNKVMKRGKGTLFGTQERQLRVQDGKPTLWQYDKSLGDYMQIPLSEDQVRQGIDGLAASIGVYDRKRNKPFLPTKAKKKSNKKVELP